MTTTPVTRDAPADGFGANPRARTRLYRDGTYLLRDFPVADISEYLTDAASFSPDGRARVGHPCPPSTSGAVGRLSLALRGNRCCTVVSTLHL